MIGAQPSLDRAVNDGAIPGLSLTPFFVGWTPPGIDSRLVDLANTIDSSPPIQQFPAQAQWIDPGRDTRAQAYQDKWFVVLKVC